MRAASLIGIASWSAATTPSLEPQRIRSQRPPHRLGVQRLEDRWRGVPRAASAPGRAEWLRSARLMAAWYGEPPCSASASKMAPGRRRD
jgi:hypothetical protein